VSVRPDVANYLNNEMRGRLVELEEQSSTLMQVLGDGSVPVGQFEIKFFNRQGREVKPHKG
jgi:hypothetical protein